MLDQPVGPSRGGSGPVAAPTPRHSCRSRLAGESRRLASLQRSRRSRHRRSRVRSTRHPGDRRAPEPRGEQRAKPSTMSLDCDAFRARRTDLGPATPRPAAAFASGRDEASRAWRPCRRGHDRGAHVIEPVPDLDDDRLRRSILTSPTSIARVPGRAGSIASSGSADQPPFWASSISALWRSKVLDVPRRAGARPRSRNATNYSPAAEATKDHVSIDADVPDPARGR